MAEYFFMPPMNITGTGALKSAGDEMVVAGYKKALIVTDEALHRQVGATKVLTNLLTNLDISYAVFDKVTPNPTIAEVDEGLELLKSENCDFIISFGGGSPHDCAKGIGIVATNGGSIRDYAGVNKMRTKMLPTIAVNTTSGTGSEMTRFAIITDEAARSKFPVVDWRCTPSISVDDPALMVGMPPGLTAATGMDALSHAIEAYVSTAATPLTNPGALHAIELVIKSLTTAYKDGKNEQARADLTYAEFLAGMAFNNASLGYIHAMSHQIGGVYHNLAHGVINAVLMPYIVAYNGEVAGDRFLNIAKAMGADPQDLSTTEAVEYVIEKLRGLNQELNIPLNLADLGVKEEDIPYMAANALQDPCCLTNPRQVTSVTEMESLFSRAWAGETKKFMEAMASAS
ncbi:MAG: iron-containing alcohol dehydrogenase [Xenococcaceae cyanobacterium MO_188.B29]|nr:iron-containing alcohol dehydrogenase [Xenococcaceae cyanobacterium MO_188.B29]